MSQSAQTIQKANGSKGSALLKALLYVVALVGIGFSMVTIDLPNQKYIWVGAEVVIGVLLILGLISSLRRAFGGNR